MTRTFFIVIFILTLAYIGQAMALGHFAFGQDGFCVITPIEENHATPAHNPQDQWNPAMVILVVTSILTSIGSLVTLVITALVKAKVELQRQLSTHNLSQIASVHRELVENTRATEEVKVAVDQAAFTKLEDKNKTLEKENAKLEMHKP